MTFKKLTDEIHNLTAEPNTLKEYDDLMKTEMKVFFDFPIDGRMVKYDIKSITKNGIMLNNHEVEKPTGH